MISRFITAALIAASLSLCDSLAAQGVVPVPAAHITAGTQWQGRKVGMLGDSMSTLRDTTQSKRFYNYLADLLGIEPHVYAKSGNNWKDLRREYGKMSSEHPDDLDAILIWAGTNDYNQSTPIGQFFTESREDVNVNGTLCERTRRTHVMSDSTFCGRINQLLSTIKDNYPHAQTVILTPIHRGFARFRNTNVQPPECYANGCGLYIDDYIAALRRAGEIWSMPVIDLYGISGLYPMADSHTPYIQKADTDRLHPSDRGHYRLARTLQYQLLTLPVGEM